MPGMSLEKLLHSVVADCLAEIRRLIIHMWLKEVYGLFISLSLSVWLEELLEFSWSPSRKVTVSTESLTAFWHGS